MNSMSLYDAVQSVNDEESFLAFARALAADRAHSVLVEAIKSSSPYGPDAGGWENKSIEGFLEAAISWAEDTNFGRTQALDDNPWKRFAVFLYLGKIYE